MSDASRVRIERSRVRNVIRVTAQDHCVYFQHSERECAKSTGNHVDWRHSGALNVLVDGCLLRGPWDDRSSKMCQRVQLNKI